MAGARGLGAKEESLYGVTPGVAMMQKWIAGLKEKTGRTLEEWVTLIQKEGPKDEKARKEWLKTKHKLGTNSAWFLAERADGRGDEEDSPEKYLKSAVKYVEDQYSGPKEQLRPVYDELLKLGKSMGPDAMPCPLQDDGAFLPEPCVRANQANNEFAGGPRIRVDALQGEAAKAFD